MYRVTCEQFTLFGPATGLSWLVPAALGVAGAVVSYLKERRAFYLLMALTAITGRSSSGT
jgi:hypothetical protein